MRKRGIAQHVDCAIPRLEPHLHGATLEGQHEGASPAGRRLGPALQPTRLGESVEPLALMRLGHGSFVLAHSFAREILMKQ
jgi:hypothetical protein